jgi:uncharacterized protein YdaU (DUF1376 family)
MIPDSKLTWFSFNPSEFLTRTVGLPNRDVGAYIKLLSYSWVNGPMPNDARVMASIAGKADMALITARFFEVNEDGKLCDPRLEASRLEAAKILEANRKRTAKASESRWKDSPLRKGDDSVTATEDKDKDKTLRKPDSEKTGQDLPNVVPILHKKQLSVTQDEKASVGELTRDSFGQKSEPDGEAQGRPAPAYSSAPPAHGPDWEAA